MSTAPVPPDDLELDEEEKRVPRRRSRAPTLRRSASPARTRRRIHPLLRVGIGLVVAVLLWSGVLQAVSWGTSRYNDMVYGNPRMFQADAIVGHGDSAQHPGHFIEGKWHSFLDFFLFVPVLLLRLLKIRPHDA
jgi:hypothetical protein